MPSAHWQPPAHAAQDVYCTQLRTERAWQATIGTVVQESNASFLPNSERQELPSAWLHLVVGQFCHLLLHTLYNGLLGADSLLVWSQRQLDWGCLKAGLQGVHQAAQRFTWAQAWKHIGRPQNGAALRNSWEVVSLHDLWLIQSLGHTCLASDRQAEHS